MKIGGRWLIVYPILLMALVQGVYGIQITASGGSNGESSLVSMNFDTLQATTVSSQMAISGAYIVPTTHIDGPIPSFTETHQATDRSRKTAQVNVNVVNAPNGLDYSSQVLPQEGALKKNQPWLSAEQWLTVPKADSIKCTATASYGKTLFANVGTEMLKGQLPEDYVTLTGYNSKAYASATQVEASQTATDGTADSIKTFAKANNNRNRMSAISDISISSGSLSGFNGDASATYAEAKANQRIDASGDLIHAVTNAENNRGMKTSSDFSISSGSLSGFNGDASAKDAEAKATQSMDASGNSIHAVTNAENKKGMKTSSDVSTTSGSLNGFNGDASAKDAEAKATQSMDASGDTIKAFANTENKEGDKTSTNLEAHDGSISTFKQTATSTTSQATASEGANSIKVEDHLVLDGNAYNKKGNNAAMKMKMGAGSLEGYLNSATATKSDAKASESADSAKAKYIQAYADAFNYNGQDAAARIEMGDGSLVDYSNSAKSAPNLLFGQSVNSAQTFNYALANDADDITVETKAFDSIKGESANVLSTVKNGYVFLYSDKSEVKDFPVLSTKATASASINAVGTIDVQSNAKNTKNSDELAPIRISGKLAADIESVADSKKADVKPPTIYNGLAFMAVDRDALPIVGHAGVGVWNDDGTWTIGSLQGGSDWDLSNGFGTSVLPGDDNKGWSAHDLTWPEVQKLLSSSDDYRSSHTVTGKVLNWGSEPKNHDSRPGSAYDHIKLVRDSSYTPTVTHAKTVMDEFLDRGFWFIATKPESTDPIITGNKYWSKPSNDCLDAAVEALHAYGVPMTDAPILSDSGLTAPNWYFNHDLKGDIHEVPYVDNSMVPATEVPPINDWMVNPGELIQSYINKAKSGDTITISPGIFNENLFIEKSLTLKGAGSSESGTIVDGKKSGSVFTIGKIDPNIDVKLYDMLIRNGIGSSDYNYNGGGILNKGTLTVDHCTITNNAADSWGGGIYSSGPLTVADSTILNNNADYGAGIFLDNYGNPVSALKAEITNSEISKNVAQYSGGGVFNYDGDLMLAGNTISENWAYKAGAGGIYNSGTLEMVSGAISGNQAGGLGAGTGGGVDNYGTFTMKGGSISENTARGDDAWGVGLGGGIYNFGTFNLEAGNINGNTAENGGGIYNSGTVNLKGGSISSNTATRSISALEPLNGGGGIYNNRGTLFIGGTTQIIDNKATSGYGGGILSDLTYGGSVKFDGTGVLVKSNKAKLPSPSELSWYQGWGVYTSSDISPTKINGFDPSTQVTDNTRIPEWTVNPGELIQSYINKAISGDTIEISSGIFNENLVIDKSLTLKGAGSSESGTVVDGMDSGSVFSIGKIDPSVNVNLYDMLIRGGSSSLGGGIYNHGTLNVEDCTITGNTASQWGGGIYSSGIATITGSTLSLNKASEGGGIMSQGDAFTISRSTISGNEAGYVDGTGIGGGIYSSGSTMKIKDSIISENKAHAHGGGIYDYAGSIGITDSFVSGNSADYYGGGIYNSQGTWTLTNCKITGNNAAAVGGGVYTWSRNQNVVFDGCTISGNIAAYGAGIFNDAQFDWGYGGVIPGVLNVQNSEIKENIAANLGGGIYNKGTLMPNPFIESQVHDNQPDNIYHGYFVYGGYP